MANEVAHLDAVDLHTHFCETWNEKWKNVVIRVPAYYRKNVSFRPPWNIENSLQNILIEHLHTVETEYDVAYLKYDENNILTLTRCNDNYFPHLTRLCDDKVVYTKRDKNYMHIKNVIKKECACSIKIENMLFILEKLFKFGKNKLEWQNTHEYDLQNTTTWHLITFEQCITLKSAFISHEYAHLLLTTIYEHQTEFAEYGENHVVNNGEKILTDCFLVKCIVKY